MGHRVLSPLIRVIGPRWEYRNWAGLKTYAESARGGAAGASPRGRVGEVAAIARRTRRIALQSVLAGMGMSLAAMGVAAAGLLPPVWGALLQEAIDVAVILNALRALRPPAPAVRLTAADTALTRRFRTEHQAIRADIDMLRTAADTLDEPGAMTRVRQVYATLTGEVWPHESAEEDELYPPLNQVLGRADPTAPMSRAHAEIAYQIARLGRSPRTSATGIPTPQRSPISAASQPGGARYHRARSVRPLDSGGPFGCRSTSSSASFARSPRNTRTARPSNRHISR